LPPPYAKNERGKGDDLKGREEKKNVRLVRRDCALSTSYRGKKKKRLHLDQGSEREGKAGQPDLAIPFHTENPTRKAGRERRGENRTAEEETTIILC